MTITIETSTTTIPKAIAFAVVTIGGACLLHLFDMQELAQITSTPPDAFVQSEMELHQHGLIFDFFVSLLMGGIYLGAVEIVAFFVRRTFRRYFISN